jgi:MFS family permease
VSPTLRASAPTVYRAGPVATGAPPRSARSPLDRAADQLVEDGLEAFGVGIGTDAFVAYIARATHPAYTATQFALFTSLAAMPRTFANAATGWLVEALGWAGFFLLCAVLAVPGMLLLFKVAPWDE